jgi:hypothetical protein
MSVKYSRLIRCGFIILWLVTLTACTGNASPTPPPTPAPTLNANLWVDFPSVRIGQRQAANIAVTDPTGAPVSGITAILVITAGSYKEEYHFPVTGADGTARVEVMLPQVNNVTTFSMEVVAVDSKGGADGAKTSFELYP